MGIVRHSLPAQEQLQRWFTYNPETGELRWSSRPDEAEFSSAGQCRRWNRLYAGTEAGHTSASMGYRITHIPGEKRQVLAHRIIWKMMTGKDPNQIDHINLDRTDNRWVNLREASIAQNCQNGPSRRDGGLKGAYRVSNSPLWQAVIYAHGKRCYLGCYATEQEAHAAYCRAAAELHGEFARAA